MSTQLAVYQQRSQQLFSGSCKYSPASAEILPKAAQVALSDFLAKDARLFNATMTLYGRSDGGSTSPAPGSHCLSRSLTQLRLAHSHAQHEHETKENQNKKINKLIVDLSLTYFQEFKNLEMNFLGSNNDKITITNNIIYSIIFTSEQITIDDKWHYSLLKYMWYAWIERIYFVNTILEKSAPSLWITCLNNNNLKQAQGKSRETTKRAQTRHIFARISHLV
mgnify:CR=1 FL=1